jgi:hypothetical protein
VLPNWPGHLYAHSRIAAECAAPSLLTGTGARESSARPRSEAGRICIPDMETEKPFRRGVIAVGKAKNAQ